MKIYFMATLWILIWYYNVYILSITLDLGAVNFLLNLYVLFIGTKGVLPPIQNKCRNFMIHMYLCNYNVSRYLRIKTKLRYLFWDIRILLN
jgi:hypothetical protein